MSQIDPARTERAGPPPAKQKSQMAPPNDAEYRIAPRRPDSSSVNADEVARLLASGEAVTRIDAAAAVADAQRQSNESAEKEAEDPRERRRPPSMPY